MTHLPSILILDDEHHLEFGELARDCGFKIVETAANLAEAETKWARRVNLDGFDVAIVDLKLSNVADGGWRFIGKIREKARKIRTFIIVYSAYLEEEKVAYSAITHPAEFAFMTKEDSTKLEVALNCALERVRKAYQSPIIVESESDKRLFKDLRDVAQSNLAVLITGNSGSGKEWVARRIAAESKGDRKLIRTINCAAYSDELLMSELFGHVKGAYSGAYTHRLGLVLEASGYTSSSDKNVKEFENWLQGPVEKSGGDKLNLIRKSSGDGDEEYYQLPPHFSGGTLFLDEVAELTQRAQAALLRVLDGLPIKPVGYDGIGFMPRLRIIAATNDIDKLSDDEGKGLFRGDLLARLNEWHIDVPDFSERPETALGIVAERCRRFGMEMWKEEYKLSNDAKKVFREKLADLVGGARELKAWAARAAVLANRRDSREISREDAEESYKLCFRIPDETRSAKDRARSNSKAGSAKEEDYEHLADKLRTEVRETCELKVDFVWEDLGKWLKSATNSSELRVRIGERLWEHMKKSASHAQRMAFAKGLRYRGWDQKDLTDDKLVKAAYGGLQQVMRQTQLNKLKCDLESGAQAD